MTDDSLFQPKRFLSIEYILSKISEEDIFLKYLSLYPKEKEGFTNPLRDDSDPDCYFYIDTRGRWKFHDIAARWNVDCFNVVEYIENCNLKEALQVIANDFELEGADNPPRERQIIKAQRETRNIETSFKVKRRRWLSVDKDYWTQFELDSKTLEFFNIAPVEVIWMHKTGDVSDKIIYRHDPKDPCYVYWFGEDKYKFYFPLRPKQKFMQSTNAKGVIQGWNQLPAQGDFLLITKSLKDVACFKMFDIPAIAPQSETILISKEDFVDVYNRFENIYTLFDFDRTGVRLMREYEEVYNLPYLLFDSSFKSPFKKEGVKDFSDHLKYRGMQETIDLIEYVKNIIT